VIPNHLASLRWFTTCHFAKSEKHSFSVSEKGVADETGAVFGD